MGVDWVLRGWVLMITAKGLVSSIAALLIAGAIQFMQRASRQDLPEGLMYGWMNQSGQIMDPSCEGAEMRPLPIESQPAQAGFGGGRSESSSGVGWINGLRMRCDWV